MSNQDNFEFCGKLLGARHPAFLVAEIGFNHNGDVELAKRMIESAAKNGADAVKLQTFVASEMISKSLLVDDPDNPGSEIPFYEFFQRYELSRADYEVLIAYADKLSVPLFSTPFDEASLDMLVELVEQGAIKPPKPMSSDPVEMREELAGEVQEILQGLAYVGVMVE